MVIAMQGPKGPTGDKGLIGNKGPTGDASNVVGAKGPLGVPTAVGVWRSTDYGYHAWTYDQYGAYANIVYTAGLLYAMRLPLRAPQTVAGIAHYVNVAGAGLVAGQCFTVLYDASTRALLGTSADQSTAWQTVGLAKAPFVGGPLNLAAGWYYVGWWAQGTTIPGFIRVSAYDVCSNLNLPNGSYRSAIVTAGGVTTTPPNPLPSTFYGRSYLYWCALY